MNHYPDIARLGCSALLSVFALLISSVVGADEPTIDADLPRIVAAGDFHGDYGAFEAVITGAGLVDDNGNWIAGETIFIQLGDLPDRGPDTRRIITELRELQDQAEATGGEVIVLVGNHEALLMTGDFRYLHPGEIEAFRTDESEATREAAWSENRDEIIAAYREQDADRSDADIKSAWQQATPLGLVELAEAWSPEGEIGVWVIEELQPAVILADSLFVHGGLSAAYADQTLDEMAVAMKQALQTQSRDRTAIIHDSLGPMWYRGLHRSTGAAPVQFEENRPTLTVDEEIDTVLKAFGVDRIIVGHTPSTDGIAVAHGGRVIRIDTGMSAVYEGVISWLEIEDGQITAYNDGIAIPVRDMGGTTVPFSALGIPEK